MMARDGYDQYIFLKSDPTFQKWNCASCNEEFNGDELDENEFCEDCAQVQNERFGKRISTDEEYLIELADALDQAEREHGVIKMSDELAKQAADTLRQLVRSLEQPHD